MYFKIIDKKLYEWGKLKQIFLSQRLKTLKEAIDGIMLIKISNLSNFFLNQFKYSSDISINLTKKLLFLNNAVKYFLELFTILILIILIFFLINRGFSKLEILSLLSLYAICSFKLLPSANRITVNIQSMKFGISVLPVIKKELFQVHNKKEYLIHHQIKFENKLILKNIFFSYDSNFSVFENLNLEIKKNDFIGILGESGSGKSTFINLFCGLLFPTKGEIFIDTVDITKNYFDMRKTIGYVPQKIFLIDDTIKANIALGNENYSIKRINDIIKESNFAKFIEELPNGIDTKIGEDGNRLSIGQKQRLNILRALYNDPEILIFDESSSALDEKNEEIFLNLIMEFKSKKTVIFITHKSKLLKDFDKIYEIKNKQMTQVK
jgi:ABC-type bacteriocin/lantibiotic exporter with double-glycine peptidase domain